ncbi:sensor histidine kinase [Tenggerimyces flavus]|uniref:Sensor histidine kinase n=1 Tax=Tenggerimyces flavus TaxID=1708749 RepID=A0ABV7YPR9_9ACTN|nr:histidine kinase [Tenggerimyces flavus]MBM7786461.1 signal transduction histidine kinase [Tenggerimyces flavus]
MSARRVAWLLAAVLVLELAAVTTGVWVAGSDAQAVVESYTLTNTAFGLTFGSCGFVIAYFRPKNPIGWLFLAGAIGHLTSAWMAPWGAYGVEAGWPEVALKLLATIFALAWPMGIGLAFPLALLLFPDGKPPSPRWRWVVYAFVLAGLLFVTWLGTEPGELVPGATSYLVLPFYDSLTWLWSVATVVGLPQALLVIVSLIVRYRRGDEMVRRQLLWFLLAVILAFAMNAQRFVSGDGPILLLLGFGLIPAAVAIAIVRHQLFDIRLVVSRTVTYLLLTAAVVAGYIGLVAMLDNAVRQQIGLGSSILATIVIAVVFNPVRVRLQGVVDRLFYGDRGDPVRAISRVGQRLLETDGADQTLTLDAVREALRLPYAELAADGQAIASSGVKTDRVHAVPLRLGDETLGELVVGLRTGEDRLSAADAHVLELMAVPLTMAVRSAALAAEVQDSRERIVAGREEERRRLRRDLHDGLGPTLTGVAYKLDAARNMLTTEPERTEQLLRELRATTTGAIDDIRRVVYGLRPPSLDELGLAGALRQQAGRLSSRSDGSPLAVLVKAPAEMPELPAAVEVAAYRIAVEALTNVARHSSATEAVVELTVADGALHVEVADDHRSQAPWRPGVGLSAMVERATEVGGTCTAGPSPSGGRVLASLPI